jgi:hypothetical protein
MRKRSAIFILAALTVCGLGGSAKAVDGASSILWSMLYAIFAMRILVCPTLEICVQPNPPTRPDTGQIRRGRQQGRAGDRPEQRRCNSVAIRSIINLAHLLCQSRAITRRRQRLHALQIMRAGGVPQIDQARGQSRKTTDES